MSEKSKAFGVRITNRNLAPYPRFVGQRAEMEFHCSTCNTTNNIFKTPDDRMVCVIYRTFSKNFDGDCHGCGESVLLPNGTIAPSPCKKDTVKETSLDPLIGKYPDSGDLPYNTPSSCNKELGEASRSLWIDAHGRKSPTDGDGFPSPYKKERHDDREPVHHVRNRRYLYKVLCVDCPAIFDILDELEAHWVDVHEMKLPIKQSCKEKRRDDVWSMQ